MFEKKEEALSKDYSKCGDPDPILNEREKSKLHNLDPSLS
jgi:hypothetical protein